MIRSTSRHPVWFRPFSLLELKLRRMQEMQNGPKIVLPEAARFRPVSATDLIVKSVKTS